jgi:midasin
MRLGASVSQVGSGSGSEYLALLKQIGTMKVYQKSLEQKLAETQGVEAEHQPAQAPEKRAGKNLAEKPLPEVGRAEKAADEAADFQEQLEALFEGVENPQEEESDEEPTPSLPGEAEPEEAEEAESEEAEAENSVCADADDLDGEELSSEEEQQGTDEDPADDEQEEQEGGEDPEKQKQQKKEAVAASRPVATPTRNGAGAARAAERAILGSGPASSTVASAPSPAVVNSSTHKKEYMRLASWLCWC